MLIGLVLAAVLPIIFVIALGYVGGRTHAFPSDAVATLSKLTLNFALPAALFTSTVAVRRTTLIQQLPTFLLFALVLAVFWVVPFLIGKFLFHNGTAGAAIQAAVVGMPSVPFFGFVILPVLVGKSGDVAVSVGSLAINLLPVPATMLTLALAGPRAAGSTPSSVIQAALLNTIKSPIVIAPVAGAVLVLLDVRLPQLAISTLQVIGNASSGVALFVGGLVLSSVAIRPTLQTLFNLLMKDIGMPALALGVCLLLSVSSLDVKQVALLAAIPSGQMGVLLATSQKTYQREAATSMAAAVLGFAVVLPLLLVLLGAG